MKTFIIQSNLINGHNIPAQSYGYTVIEAIQYTNWFRGEKIYDFALNGNVEFEPNCLTRDCVPIGSVEYVIAWLKKMGVAEVKPLNIPPELWKFCDRQIKLDYCSNINGHWMLKDTNEIKSAANGEVWFNGDGGNDKKYFLTQWVDDIDSEWRVFALNKSIRGIRCYSGDEFILPNREYIQSIVDSYDKKCYTLDVFVNDKGKHTEIMELHDFFSCGLYGFEDFSVLPMMWITTINELLNKR